MHRLLQTIFLSALAVAAPLEATSSALGACEEDVSHNFSGWNLSDFESSSSYKYTTPAHQNDYGSVGFNVSNLATVAVPYTVPCSGESDLIGDPVSDTIIYSCPVPNSATGPVSFTYDWNSGMLVLNQTWMCNDQGYA